MQASGRTPGRRRIAPAFLTLIVVLCISKIVTSWTVRRQSRSLRFDRHRDSARGACVDRNQLRETFCFALVRDR